MSLIVEEWRKDVYMLTLLTPEVIDELDLEVLLPAILEVCE